MEEPGQSKLWHTTVDRSGRVHVPAELRSELNVTPGTDLVWSRTADGLKLHPFSEVLHDIQEYFLSVSSASENWSEELIRERREEALRE